MLANKSLTDVLDAFSSSDPTPGGGSAAALSGALGASLLAMVAGLPKTKTNTPEERASLDTARAKILALRSRLVDLIDRDAASYDAVVAAYRLPKSNDAEKRARTVAIQAALKLATEVPLETLLTINEVLQQSAGVAAAGNPSARSDVTVAIQVLSIAGSGALLNIETNLGSVTDTDFVQDIVRRVRDSYDSTNDAMRQTYQSAGIVDLLKQVNTRFKLHGHGGTGEPPKEFFVKMAMESLQRMGSVDARRALEQLAASADNATANLAKQALGKVDGATT
jgi:formiminotetrahydrofolate cyclodeaminase